MLRSLWLGLCCVAIALVTLAAPAHASLYTFENLTVDQNLIGQDNWIHANTLATSGPEMKVRQGTGFNTSKVASPFSGNAQLVRQNDANFSIPTFTGTEKIYIQVDVKFGLQQALFGLSAFQGATATNDSQSPTIGVARNFMLPPSDTSMFFNFRHFGAGAAPQDFIPIADVAPEIQPGDWLTMRLEIDLAANGGNGLANAFYKDLTLGQTDFTPIPGLQNKSANLLGQPAANKYFWDRMYLRGGINVEDNSIDNLEVGIIPEPTSIGLFAMAFVALAAQRRKKA
jgi:hypothetical protein